MPRWRTRQRQTVECFSSIMGVSTARIGVFTARSSAKSPTACRLWRAIAMSRSRRRFGAAAGAGRSGRIDPGVREPGGEREARRCPPVRVGSGGGEGCGGRRRNGPTPTRKRPVSGSPIGRSARARASGRSRTRRCIRWRKWPVLGVSCDVDPTWGYIWATSLGASLVAGHAGIEPGPSWQPWQGPIVGDTRIFNCWSLGAGGRTLVRPDPPR
jgi:hypothetical protein